jgi:hypothetical protein
MVPELAEGLSQPKCEECETNNLQILKPFDAYSDKLIINVKVKNQNNHPQIII